MAAQVGTARMGVESGQDERCLEVPSRIVHGVVDRARAQHLAECVDRAVMNNDPAIRALLPNLLEFTARRVLRLDAPTHDRSLSRRPARRSIEAAWRAKKAS